MIKHSLTLFASICLTVCSLFAQQLNDQINWPAFMEKYGLQWQHPPLKWEEAPYFGNGFIGSMVYCDSTDRHNLIIQVFRTDVQDHRTDSAGWTAYARPRLPIGYFTLRFKGAIIKLKMRQSLWNAELNGIITTTKGKIKICHFVSALSDLIYTKTTSISGTEAFKAAWHPAKAISTRTILFPNTPAIIPKFAAAYGSKYLNRLQSYRPNPPAVTKSYGATSICVQELLAGGQFTTAWKILKSGTDCLMVATIQNSYPEHTSASRALNIISQVTNRSYSSTYNAHIAWWHHFYTRSFISLPNKKLEGMYWLQLYKLGSATRPNGPIMDTSGPWFQTTPWPYLTWDLNVQLCYWTLNASNHLDLAQSLPNSLYKNRRNLIANVSPADWRRDAAYLPLATGQDLIGTADDDQRYAHLNADLPWAMHNVWLIYRHSMDRQFLRDRCYPLLKRSMNYYLHQLQKDSNGVFHVPLGYSPEYPGQKYGLAGETRDANIDIALLKWGLQALIDAARVLNTDLQEIPHWQAVLAHFAPYPVDKQGFMIGADLPFDQSHRHYSHLLMIYPLYLVNADQPEQLQLIKTSLATWAGAGQALKGYSYTGAASIAAAIGDGDGSLAYLKGLDAFLLPNGLYTEKGPCLETPLSAAKALQDMLLQSWGGKLRIFPALPHSWKEAVIHRFLAEGAFEVSARLKAGQINFVIIKSLAGSPCIIHCKLNNPIAIKQGQQTKLTKLAPDTYQINLKKNETALIRSKFDHSACKIIAVSAE